MYNDLCGAPWGILPVWNSMSMLLTAWLLFTILTVAHMRHEAGASETASKGTSTRVGPTWDETSSVRQARPLSPPGCRNGGQCLQRSSSATIDSYISSVLDKARDRETIQRDLMQGIVIQCGSFTDQRTS